MVIALLFAVAPSPPSPGLVAIERLRSPDAAVRLAAVESLSALGEGAKPAVPALVARLRDRDLRVRMAAALALGNARSVEAVPALGRALEDVAPVGTHAAMALWMIGPGSRKVVRRLREVALRPPRDDVERARHRNAVGAWRTVGIRGPDIGPLRKALRSPSAQVRFSAARLLGFAERPDRRAREDLERVAREDGHPRVRGAAAEAAEALARCAASGRPCRTPPPEDP